MGVALETSLRVTISRDRLCAFLAMKDPTPDMITTETVTAKVREAGLRMDDEVTARIEQIVSMARDGTLPDKPILLAKGQAPIDGVPSQFQPLKADPSTAETDANERVNYRESRIVIAEQGGPIGFFAPASPPVNGVDVCGKALPAKRVPASLELGKNVQLADDGKTILATCAGKLEITRHDINVIEVVTTEGDVDYSSGNVDSPTDVLINGTVREQFSVCSKKSVSIRDTVEAAVVEAGTHVQVAGGITAHHNGRIEAGGEICAKFCDGADLRSGGDITINRQVMNSRVYCGGRLSVTRGAVIGGYTYAREGAKIRELGNESNLKTEIAIGIDPVTYAKADSITNQMKKKKEAAQKIRSSLQPLMAQLKRLTPQQRERATELMYEADQMDAEVAEYEKSVNVLFESNSPPPDVHPQLMVHSRIHPAVTIIFGNRKTVIDKEWRGPLKIVRRLVDRREEVLLIDQLSGSVHTLPSCEYSIKTEDQRRPE